MMCVWDGQGWEPCLPFAPACFRRPICGQAAFWAEGIQTARHQGTRHAGMRLRWGISTDHSYACIGRAGALL